MMCIVPDSDHNYYILYRVSATLPTGQLSNIPWRRTGVKYATNEVL